MLLRVPATSIRALCPHGLPPCLQPGSRGTFTWRKLRAGEWCLVEGPRRQAGSTAGPTRAVRSTVAMNVAREAWLWCDLHLV